MRSFYLVLVFLFCCTVSFAQGIIGLLNKSEEFVALLSQDKYDDAHAYFAAEVKPKITPANLMSMWVRITGQSGKFLEIEGESSSKDGEYVVVTLKCKFAGASEGFRFVYNKAGELVGLFLLPRSTAEKYVMPAYADTTKSIEKQISVNTPGHVLAGVATLPKNAANFPIVVLVHGSGPGDMDETVGPNKPFKDLALGLAARGIATIRYVKRTLLYPGEFSGPITVKDEVMDDALQAIAVAKTIPGVDKSRIYLLGHSLGGMLAPRIASLSPDLAGVILAAAPARSMTDLMIEQNINAFSNSGDTTKAGRQRMDDNLKLLQITRIKQLSPGMKADSILLFAPASYWIDMNNYDQVATARKLKGRILVIQGENDIQVTMDDFKLWKEGLQGKPGVATKNYPDLDHLLSAQPGKDWSGAYRKQVNVAGYLVNDIAAWVTAKD